MNEDKLKEVIPDLLELTGQSINSVGRIFDDIERLRFSMHLSEILTNGCEESASPEQKKGSIEQLEGDVSYLRMRIDVVEKKLRKELNYLLGEGK